MTDAKQNDDAALPAKIPEPDDSSDTTSPPPDPVSTASRPALWQRIPWLASVAILLTGLVALMSSQNAEQATQLKSMQQQAAELDQQMLQEQKQFQRQMREVQDSISQYQGQVEKLTTDLSTAQRERFDLEEKIKQVSLQASAKGRDPLKWRVAEVEYLLALANHRLILSQDQNTALTALKDADNRLRSIADPGLTEIRMSIASEIKALQAVQLPDIAGMALQLSALVDGIGQLPLVQSKREFETEDKSGEQVKSWDQIPAAIWRDIKGMISIRRSEHAIEPLLPPDELHFLSQNLGLKLEQARLALLRKDTALFRSNLKDTGLWVSRYFDHDATAVTSVLDTINTFMATELTPAMPDISTSLRQLRSWRDRQESALYRPTPLAQPPRATARAPAPEPEQKPEQKKEPPVAAAPTKTDNPDAARETESVSANTTSSNTASANAKDQADNPSPPPVAPASQAEIELLPENAAPLKPDTALGLSATTPDSSADAAEQAASDGDAVSSNEGMTP